MDLLKSKVIGKVGQSFLAYLNDKELHTLIDWGKSDSFQTLKTILEKIEKSHLSMLIANEIKQDSLLTLAERRGRHIEDQQILKLPELAKLELENRNKLIK